MVKVLVVDDSAFMRKMIGDLLEEDPRITVLDKARNGKDAIDKIKLLQPDVITMDVEMPLMDGLESLKIIMEEHPKPVIMVSSMTTDGAEATMRAMDYGAVDFISKPSGSISLDIHKLQKDLINKVLLAANVPIWKLKRGTKSTLPFGQDHNDTLNLPLDKKQDKELKRLNEKTIIAIGTSTGGPRALQQVLTSLPKDYPYPILVVQHMPKGFTKSLSTRLNSLSEITVKEAVNGEIIKKGIAYIAPGGYHLKVREIGTSVSLLLDQSPIENGHRPSVDTMFHSLAGLPNQDVLAVILTGMGTDGRNGLINLKQNHRTFVIAESEETAVVFGMPRAAIESKQVDLITNIEHVSSFLTKLSY